MSGLPTPYQDFIHLSRYSRWIESKGRRETWEETVARYFDFFTKHLKEHQNYDLDDKDRKRLETAIKNLKVMPSMRALMTAGEALKRDNIAGYNCAFVTGNRVRSLDEVLYVLMCGTGMGFSVERQFVQKLPTISEEFDKTDTTIVVADSKQGWAKGYKELVSLLITGAIPNWDLSKIRPAGERLKTFGGRASGPEPLDDLMHFTVDIFKHAAGRKLTSYEVHRLFCKIAEVVVVGGVRRSALISLSNLTDQRMATAKSGQWWVDTPEMALANNSVAYTEKPDMGIFMKEWNHLYESKSGERGIFNREAAVNAVKKLGEERRDPNHEFGCNPCCLVGDTKIQTDHGIMTIKDIVEAGADQYKVLGFNIDSDKIEWVDVKAGQLTRPDAELIEIEFINSFGSSETLRLTPDHRVFTENRGYVQAQSLNNEDIIIFNPV